MAKAPVDMSEAAHQAGEAAFAEAIELAAGRGRLPIVYEKLDAFCDEALRGAPIACKAGCSTCCRQWVPGVKASEIEQIAQRAVGDRALVAALQVRLQAYERLSGDRDLEYARLGLPCVFLTAEGTCGIREIRPATCRTFFSFGPPERCAGDPEGTGFMIEPHADFDQVLARASRDPRYTGELVRDLLVRLS